MSTIVDTTVNNLGAILNSKADLNSPSFTGTPTVLTPSVGDKSKQVANAEFVQVTIKNAFDSTTIFFSNQFINGGLSAMAPIKLNPATIIPTKTPKSSSDTGVVGEVCMDDKYIYKFTSAFKWVRTPFSTF